MMERRSCRPGNAADAASDIIMRLAYHILTLGFFIIIDVDGCPRQSTPIERAEMAVREAEAKMTDRVIILPSFEDSTVPAENVRRVPLGSTVTFACNVTTSSGSAATQVIWRHRNKTVRANETAQNNIGYFYRLQNTANTSLLSIHNATRATAGTVECLRPCSGRDLCLIEDYELRLQYRVQEVFGPAMRNVSTPLWKFSMTCAGRFDCSTTLAKNHFIWKYDGQFVTAPYAYLAAIAERSHFPGVDHGEFAGSASPSGETDPLCITTLIMTMKKTINHRPARVDCWVRTDVDTHQWFVQSAYVQFTQSFR